MNRPTSAGRRRRSASRHSRPTSASGRKASEIHAKNDFHKKLTMLKDTMSEGMDIGGLLQDVGKLIGHDQTTEHENIAMIDHNNKAQVHNALREIVIYVLFMLVYTLSTIRGLNDADVYKFGAHIEGQLGGVEMLPEHSPTWGKNLYDVGTVEEFYHWLQGPFVHTIFSPSTFDGDPDWAFLDGKPQGYVLGYGKIIGAVRISQLRVESNDCTGNVPGQVAHYYNFTCYGANGMFTKGSELKEDFGHFKSTAASPTNFRYDGYSARLINENGTSSSASGSASDSTGGNESELLLEPLPAGSVEKLRGKLYSEWTSHSWSTYPVGAYAIQIDPSMGVDAGRKLVRDIVDSRYIDLYTRLVVVEFTVYNAMLDRVCFVRAAAELSKAGGVATQLSFSTVRLWENFSKLDQNYLIMNILVGAFYVYFALQELREFWQKGAVYWSEYLNIAQSTNIFLYIYATVATAWAPSMFPTDEDIGIPAGGSFMGHMYVAFGPAVAMKRSGVAVQALNALLNWIKMIAYLSYAPTFAVMNETLAKSAHDVSGFLAVFMIVGFGFAQSHVMVFGGRLRDFRTIGQTVFTLVRSLLGDFDFEQLQRGHSYMGPFLFIVFVALAVFVVLNMLIAIISDAYAECRDRYRDVPPVQLRKELTEYLHYTILSVPVFGGLVKMCEEKVASAKKGAMDKVKMTQTASRTRRLGETKEGENGVGSTKVVPTTDADEKGEGSGGGSDAEGAAKIAGMMASNAGRKGSLFAQAVRRSSLGAVAAGALRRGSIGSSSGGSRQASRQNSITGADGESGDGSHHGHGGLRRHSGHGRRHSGHGRRHSGHDHGHGHDHDHGHSHSHQHSTPEHDSLMAISDELGGMRKELRSTMNAIARNFERQAREQKAWQAREKQERKREQRSMVDGASPEQRLMGNMRRASQQAKEQQQERSSSSVSNQPTSAAMAFAAAAGRRRSSGTRAERDGSRHTLAGLRPSSPEKGTGRERGSPERRSWAGDLGAAAREANVAASAAAKVGAMAKRLSLQRTSISGMFSSSGPHSGDEGASPGGVRRRSLGTTSPSMQSKEQQQKQQQEREEEQKKANGEILDGMIKRHLRRVSVTMMPDMPETKRLEEKQQQKEEEQQQQKQQGQGEGKETTEQYET